MLRASRRTTPSPAPGSPDTRHVALERREGTVQGTKEPRAQGRRWVRSTGVGTDPRGPVLQCTKG